MGLLFLPPLTQNPMFAWISLDQVLVNEPGNEEEARVKRERQQL